jgi:hypothetical protein
MGWPEKIAWIAVLVALTILEVLAIHRADVNSRAERDEQNRRFNAIAERLEDSINTSRTQYGDTINHVDGVLATTQNVAELAEENLQDLTGGDSYPYVTPGIPPTGGMLADHSRFNLILRVHGSHPLTGTSVSVSRFLAEDQPGHPGYTDAGRMNRLNMGTIAPYSAASLPYPILPEIGTNGVDHWRIDASAQNGSVVEDLWFRDSADRRNWAYKYTVTKTRFLPDGQSKPEKTLVRVDWIEPKNLTPHAALKNLSSP